MADCKTRQKFRIYHSKQDRIIYIACNKNDTSIVFNEWGWEVLDHFTGKWESLAKEGDGNVLMESIGKFDIDNNLIFEGDLVMITSGILRSDKPYQIMWNDECACFALWQYGFVKMLNKVDLRTLNFYGIKVVGNIYEAPKRHAIYGA